MCWEPVRCAGKGKQVELRDRFGENIKQLRAHCQAGMGCYLLSCWSRAWIGRPKEVGSMGIESPYSAMPLSKCAY